MVRSGQQVSQCCPVLGMLAIGMRIQPKERMDAGWKPIVLMLTGTVAWHFLFMLYSESQNHYRRL